MTKMGNINTNNTANLPYMVGPQGIDKNIYENSDSDENTNNGIDKTAIMYAISANNNGTRQYMMKYLAKKYGNISNPEL